MIFDFLYIGLKTDRPINYRVSQFVRLRLHLNALNLICLYEFVAESYNKIIIAIFELIR